MKRKESGKKRESDGKINVVIRGIGRTQPRERRPNDRTGKSPGSAAHHFTKANARKYGVKGGSAQRQSLPKFADAYEAELLNDIPAAMCRKLQVPKGTTWMMLLVQRVVAEAAINASIPHVTELRDTTQGKNPDRRITMTANIERLIQDPEFLKFVELCADKYLDRERGAIHGAASTRELGTEIPSTESLESES